MSDEKKIKNPKKMFASRHKDLEAVERELKAACRPLTFISETDADVIPFTSEKPKNGSLDGYVAALGITSDLIEERDFKKFFDRLTSEEDWHGLREKKRSQHWSRLRDVLEKDLENIRVIRAGRIQIDIFIVGVNVSGHLAGVKTKGIET